MSIASSSPSFSIRQARDLVDDLFVHRPVIYWTDFLLSLTVGYAFAGIYLRSTPFSARQIVCFTVAGFALFRVASYIHEITHMCGRQLLGFRVAWNVLFGIPALMPSFFYENHIDHHNSSHYGTIRDGEYLPMGAGPLYRILLFWAQVPFLPIYIVLRFLLSPITFLSPALRNWTLEHASSFVINFRHRLMVPKSAPRRVWATVELACCLRAWAMLGVVALGYFPWTRLVSLYCLATFILGLNYVRNLTAHHYRNTGAAMSHLDQLSDSVTITGHWFWTELFFPLALRYHALHHMFPSIPYHELARAHRRLIAKLPEDSPYHQTVYPGYWSVVRQLLRDARRSNEKQNTVASA